MRFIVLTIPRTGSTLLCHALDNHPMIRCYGEILHDKGYVREREYKDRNDKQRLKELHNTDVQAYMASLHYDQNKSVVGYKIMYDHLTPKSIDYLKDTSIKVISLNRNLFEAYVSRKRSLKYGVWHILIGSKVTLPDERLTIDPKECEEYFNNVLSTIEKHKELLKSRDVFTLDYSQLSNKFDQTIRSIYKFLGVPDHQPLSRTKRSEDKPMNYRVSNYELLQSYFKNTKYGHLFK